MNPFPIQGHIVTDAQRVYQNGRDIVVVELNNGIKNFSFDSVSIAAITLNGIIQIQATTTGIALVSVLPDPFDFSTSTVTISGSGFSASATYKLWWEDQAGGRDDNGYSIICNYVNNYTLLADGSTYNTGDGSYGYYLYVSDGTNKTNAIITQNPGTGTIVTY